MGRILVVKAALMLVASAVSPAVASDNGDLYVAQTITSGTMEPNRTLGFENCLKEAVVRISGNQALLDTPGFAAMLADPGKLVTSFSYRDRYSGKPLHDEQGSYDRPHDLTCVYGAKTFDPALAVLGGKPWLERPTVLVMLGIIGKKGESLLSQDQSVDPNMIESLNAAAATIAVPIKLPSAAQFAAFQLTGETLIVSPYEDLALFNRAVNASGVVLGGGLLLEGSGWTALWRLQHDGKEYQWGGERVSYDDAFRMGMRGAAQILSGNGQPK